MTYPSQRDRIISDPSMARYIALTAAAVAVVNARPSELRPAIEALRDALEKVGR